MPKKTPPPVEDPQTGCLLWQGYCRPDGYAQIWDPATKRDWRGHVLVWVREHGPVPEGWEVDHVYARGCRHRHCIALSHLEAVPKAENLRRQADANWGEVCRRGHSRAENTKRTKEGYRYCYACVREGANRRSQQNPEPARARARAAYLRQKQQRLDTRKLGTTEP